MQNPANVYPSGLKTLPVERKGKFCFKARLIQQDPDRDPVIGKWSDPSAFVIIE